MLSRSFISAVSFLRASESRVLVASIRSLHAMNGRAIRPASFVLSRLMSSQEASSTEANATRTKQPLIPPDHEVQVATMERANSRRRIGVTGASMILLTLTLAGLGIGIKSSQKGPDENTPVSLQERNVQRYVKLKGAAAAKGKLKEAKKKRSRRG